MIRGNDPLYEAYETPAYPSRLYHRINIAMIDFTSPYACYANQTLSWLPMDTQDLYLRNLKTNKEKLIANGWVDTEITYTFNSHGFRCNEFTSDPTIMFLGCSYTCGVGLPIHASWTSIVASKLNLASANLGIGGYSSDTAFRLCYGWIDVIQPKLVVMLQPHASRFELVKLIANNSVEIKTISSFSYDVHKSFYADWISHDSNSELNSLKNLLAIKSLCTERNIKFINFTLSELHSNDWARDLAHSGIESNKQFAKRVLSTI